MNKFWNTCLMRFFVGLLLFLITVGIALFIFWAMGL